MKKRVLILLVVILAISTSASAQLRNKEYNLFYLDTIRSGQVYRFPSGMAFRNDTLFIDVSAPITTVGVKREKDTINAFSYILLKSFKEQTTHATDTTKKIQPKETPKASAAKRTNKKR